MFEKIDKIVNRVINQKDIQKTAVSAQVCFSAQKIFFDLFPNFSEKINIESFSKGTLKISSPNSAINQEIQLKKDQIIQKLNKKIRSGIVEDLRFGIK